MYVEESSSHLTSILSNTYALEENYAIHIKHTHYALLASSVFALTLTNSDWYKYFKLSLNSSFALPFPMAQCKDERRNL